MRLMISIISVGASFLIADALMEGIRVESFMLAIGAACIFMLLNALVKPILMILTLPITLLTLGLFIFVLNALTYWWTASWIDGFYVDSFGSAFWGSLITTFVSTITQNFSKNN